MNLFTIGSGHKSARQFFESLMTNGVRRVIDIRLNNTSQLAGFSKKPDLEYFLQAIAGIGYVHLPVFAPTEELMEAVKTKQCSWEDYEKKYRQILADRKPFDELAPAFFESACLLCSEPAANRCHRRLVAEALTVIAPGLKVYHL